MCVGPILSAGLIFTISFALVVVIVKNQQSIADLLMTLLTLMQQLKRPVPAVTWKINMWLFYNWYRRVYRCRYRIVYAGSCYIEIKEMK